MKVLQTNERRKGKNGKRVQLWRLIRRYRVTSWLNRKTCEPMYGIKVNIEGLGWADYSEDGKAVLFDEIKGANDKIAALKKEFREKRKTHPLAA